MDAVAREYGDSLAFLGMARGIVRHHHERYDGGGYPDGLRAEAIPAAARLVALADVYDALRRKLPHKAAMDHALTVRKIVHESSGQFDPTVLRAFAAHHAQFDKVFQSVPN